MKEVCIIIINWNGWKDTLECLESLRSLAVQNFSVVVVDNASTNDSRQQLLDWGSRTDALKFVGVIDEHEIDQSRLPLQAKAWVYLQSSRNGGFAAGNNLGIRLALNAGCEYIWLLNNDTVVEPDALVALERRMAADTGIGMCGSMLRYYDNRQIVQAVGGVRFSYLLGRGEQLGQGLTVADPRLSALVNETPTYVAGASLMVSSEFLREVGLMEESYFLYFEEIDWAVRAERKWKVATATDSVVYHKEGASIGTASLKKRSSLSQYYLNRNLIRFYMLRKPLLLPVAIFRVLRELLKLLIQRDYQLAGTTYHAFVDALLMRSGPRR